MYNNYFYCYSNKLNCFLKALNFTYVSADINKNTDKRYWTYNKSSNLDSAIELYNSVKHIYNWKIKLVEKGYRNDWY